MPRYPELSCAECGKRIWKGTGSLPQGRARCRPCRRQSSNYRDPALVGATEFWICAKCGDLSHRVRARGQKPKFCTRCRDSNWISTSRRLAIYERDGWQCWLCEEPVEHELIGSRSEWRPSLDHVIPRSHGGSDGSGNLRTAHWWCNAARSDAKHEPEAFRVAS